VSLHPQRLVENRRENKSEIMEEMMTKVMKSVTDSMQSSDRMFVELKEKRMKFEEREFQFKMAQMVNASHSGHSSGFIVIVHTLHLPQASFIIVRTTVKIGTQTYYTQLWVFTYYDCNSADKSRILLSHKQSRIEVCHQQVSNCISSCTRWGVIICAIGG